MWKIIKKVIAKIGDIIEFIVTPAPSMEELLNNPNDTPEMKAYKLEMVMLFEFGRCNEKYVDELVEKIMDQQLETLISQNDKTMKEIDDAIEDCFFTGKAKIKLPSITEDIVKPYTYEEFLKDMDWLFAQQEAVDRIKNAKKY